MLVTVEVTDNKVSKKLMSFLKKYENDGIKIIKLKNDEDIKIDKLASEIAELIYDNTVDYSYNFDERDIDKITLSVEYKPAELQALKEILEFLSKMNIKCSFEVTNNFYINVSWYNRNIKEIMNELQDVVNKICEKYEVRNDLVILR